jgi:hypothetical protein
LEQVQQQNRALQQQQVATLEQELSAAARGHGHRASSQVLMGVEGLARLAGAEADKLTLQEQVSGSWIGRYGICKLTKANLLARMQCHTLPQQVTKSLTQ